MPTDESGPGFDVTRDPSLLVAGENEHGLTSERLDEALVVAEREAKSTALRRIESLMKTKQRRALSKHDVH